METFQYALSSKGWNPSLPAAPMNDVQLVLAFGQRVHLADAAAALRRMFPKAQLLACSTSGEIQGESVSDGTVSVTAVKFAKTTLKAQAVTCSNASESNAVGARLGQALAAPDLRHVLVLSGGLNVNGTDLAQGLQGTVGSGVSVTGGLAGDGADFKETLVISGDQGGSNLVAAVGFYGNALRVGYGSRGGWEAFGPLRRVTASEGAVLRELDGKSALAKYKEYLGDHAAQLPASALLFPLSVTRPGAPRGVVRTVLATDDANESMTFAGDVPKDAMVQLMKANTDGLAEGARLAASTAQECLGGTPSLALLVSCVGRKLVMKQRVEEEIETVRQVVGPRAAITGFYSYGELCPYEKGSPCELHNQTMTVTLLSEGP